MGNHEKVFAFCDSGCRVETLPKDYIEKMFRAKQLLINNDFQVNQRGQSEYVFNYPNDGYSAYTLDMWKLYTYHGNVTLTPIKNGVRIEGNAEDVQLFQYVNNKDDFNGTYTSCFKINNLKGKCSFATYNDREGWTTHKDIIESGEYKVTFNTLFSRVGIKASGEIILEVEYIDLFEGDIAYLHVKKKYSEDLMECQRYLLMIFSFQGYWGNPSYYISEPRIRYMASKPTITFTGNTIVMIEGANMKLQISSIELSSYLDEIKLNVSNIEDISSKVISRTINGYSSSGIIVSCEPL